MNPRILMVVGAVLVVMIIGAVGVYFVMFNKTKPVQDPAVVEAQKDNDNDGHTNAAERAAGTSPDDPSRYPGSHKKILVAREDIASNVLIRDEMVDVREVAAKGEAPDASYLDNEKDKVIGRISTVEIKSGDALVPAMVFGGKPRLSYLVPRYKRAVSLKYEQLAAVTGLVQLGDLVDVIGNFKVRRREGGEREFARTLVQNARVVALGQQFVPKAASDTSPTAVPTGLTLAVYPHEAERLIWAENYSGARLVLALRSPQNEVPARTAGVTDEMVFGATILNDARPVEVYYGGVWGGVTRFQRADGDRLGLGRVEGSNLQVVAQ